MYVGKLFELSIKSIGSDFFFGFNIVYVYKFVSICIEVTVGICTEPKTSAHTYINTY